MKLSNIYIWALAAHGEGISGSDRIFMEFARYWSKESPVNIYLWEEGLAMCRRNGLDGNVSYQLLKMKSWQRFGFLANYFARIMKGVATALTLEIENSGGAIVYSASEFWMDSLPALVVKLRFPKITWAAAWYQTAPSPIRGFSSGRYRFRALLYWLAQLPIKPLISRFADFILVNNEQERWQFPNHTKRERVIIVLGAVDLGKVKNFKLRIKNLPKVYDAVFQGRFHPQKGVLELIDIWRKVVNKKPGARLAMIGDGPLMKKVRARIQILRLKKNVELFGYLFDGPQKYRVFAQSRVVVHPAFYDSGGMAAAEAMAFGLPCVGFNLRAYESYYPQGMIKVPLGDMDRFAEKIILLLNNRRTGDKLGKEAQKMIDENWSWEKRARETLGLLQGL